MRLIDAYALFENVLEAYGGTIIDESETNLFAKMIIRAPTVNPESLQPQWIPVTERLPAENGSYIVTACDEGSPAGEGIWYSTVVVVAEYYGGSWTWYDGCCEYSLEGIVTHWMPLPKPPEEVSK